jgi:hypothetical protein
MSPTALHVVALVLVFLSGGFAALKGGDADHASLYAAIIAGLGTLSTLLAAVAPSLLRKGPPKPPSVAGMAMMLVVGVTLVWSFAVVACAQVPAITADVVGEIQCVEAQLAAGNDTFEGIALACAPLAVSDVVTIVEAELAPFPDGGTTKVLAHQASLVRHLRPGEQPKPALVH